MKTINILLIFLCLLIVSINAKAQECFTPAPAPPAWLFNPTLRSTQTTPTSYMVRVFFHIVRNSTGTGLGSDIVSTMLNRLNSDYANTGIQFQSDGFDFINDNNYYNDLTTSEITTLFSVNSHSNAIDIYVLGTSTTGMTSGVAAGIPAKSYIVHGNRYNTTTLSHEMGHCLGLYHTHHGTVTETGGDPQQCAELVNGTNATTCGDYIADTPADPNLWNGCNYAGTSKNIDANNQQYNPNSSNFMAYSLYTCRNMFSPIQIQRILDYIANTPVLQNVLIVPISGPLYVCATDGGTTYTANRFPNNASINWSNSTNITLISASGNSATFRGTGTKGESAWVKAEFSGISATRSDLFVAQYPNLIAQPNTTVPLYYYLSLSPQTPPEVSSYRWYLTDPSGVVSNTYGSSFNLILSKAGPYTVLAYGIGNCGDWISPTYIYVYIVTGILGYSYTAYPNPANDLLNVEIGEDESIQPAFAPAITGIEATDAPLLITNDEQSKNFDIRLYNEMGVQLRQTTVKKGEKVQFNLSNLPNGNYYLHIYDGVNDKPEMKQIVIKH